MSAPVLAEILNVDLPVATAARAAVERGLILQSSKTHSVLAPRLLPGFWREHSAGERTEPEAA